MPTLETPINHIWIYNTKKNVWRKGGITSTDIATKALSIKRAIVLGQVVKGIKSVQKEEKYQTLLTYINNNKERMDYPKYIKAGR